MERYLGTIIYDDLAGNWQVNMPNLEECALLKINYEYLHDEITGENGCDRLYDIPELDGLSDEIRTLHHPNIGLYASQIVHIF